MDILLFAPRWLRPREFESRVLLDQFLSFLIRAKLHTS
jgi:hypothetical protein